MEKIYRPLAPCLNCPNRKVGCHNLQCAKWAKYEADNAKWHAQQMIESECENLTRHNIDKYVKKNNKKFGTNDFED